MILTDGQPVKNNQKNTDFVCFYDIKAVNYRRKQNFFRQRSPKIYKKPEVKVFPGGGVQTLRAFCFSGVAMKVQIKTRSVGQIQPSHDASGANIQVQAEMSLMDMKETIMEMLKVIPGPQWEMWQADFEKQ